MENIVTVNKEGVEHEIEFWTWFVKTPGFLEEWVAKKKTNELNDTVAQFILEHKHDSVMDIGSGAVSVLNGLIPDENLTVVDPLGEMYSKIFDYEKYNCKCPLPIPGEEITYKNKFDIVHMRNSLDHAVDPFKVVQNLIRACRPGGYIILQHFENTATREQHTGLHQWDISLKKDGLWISGSGRKENIGIANVMQWKEKLITDLMWHVWIHKKEK